MSETRPIYKTRLRERGQVTIPPQVRERLGVREDDDVLFRVNEQGQGANVDHRTEGWIEFQSRRGQIWYDDILICSLAGQ